MSAEPLITSCLFWETKTILGTELVSYLPPKNNLPYSNKLSMDTPTCQESKDLRPPGRNPLSFGSPSRLYISGVGFGG